jgi:DNA polymerase-3 subunit epsilon
VAVLRLERPLCVFDLETTGIQVVHDRIVELCIVKVMPDNERRSKVWRVNPGRPIPAGASAVHGITDEMVADCPPFADIAKEVGDYLDGCDLAGFNSNKFDIPLLAEEMLRANVDFDFQGRLAIDVQNIFHRLEERTLSAAYKFYCGKPLENAHTAEADVLATLEVLEAQLDRYPEQLENDVRFLAEYSNRQKVVDFAGFIAFDAEGQEIFTFGKHKGRRVREILLNDNGYYSWVMNADFPLYTKKALAQIRQSMR